MAPSGSRSIRAREAEALAKAAAVPGADQTPHITRYPDLVDILPDMAVEYRALSDQIKQLEDRKKELGTELKALMDAAEATSIRGDGWVVTRSRDTETNKLSPELLLKAGVGYEILNACTITEKRAGYVQVKALKE